jgi:hypothetical protein
MLFWIVCFKFNLRCFLHTKLVYLYESEYKLTNYLINKLGKDFAAFHRNSFYQRKP